MKFIRPRPFVDPDVATRKDHGAGQRRQAGAGRARYAHSEIRRVFLTCFVDCQSKIRWLSSGPGLTMHTDLLFEYVLICKRRSSMAKPAVSRDAFRGLFALYAAKAHHDNKHDGEYRLLKLFGSSEDIPDSLLDLWSDRAEVLGTDTIGTILTPRTREIADGGATYDHASDFLHTVLRDLERNEH
jgi:hypothetical protein